MTKKFFPVILLGSILLGGCLPNRVTLEPKKGDPIYNQKNEFLDNYFRFVTPAEYPEFIALSTADDFRKFEENFWKKRDTNPLTPENEFKQLIDSRIADIKNEILANQGILFRAAGGLKGEMAQVYLLYGHPNCSDCIRKLPEGRTHAALIVWYYFDSHNKPLFRYLFYEKFGKTILFKNYTPVLSEDTLFNPIMSPLSYISNGIVISPQDVYEIWLELEFNDPDWAFRGALLEFSFYTDVRIDEALDPPEPASLVMARFKPVMTGQPDDLSGKKFFNNRFFSFIPAELNISKENRPSFSLSVGFANIDWEIKEDKTELSLNLRISFQNKKTGDIKEFAARLFKEFPVQEIEEKIKDGPVNGKAVPIKMSILLDGVRNFASSAKPGSTLRQLINELEPGEYVVNVDLRHSVTKKYSGGWREEMVIR